MQQILVVDDEEAVRSLLGRWLKSWGYAPRFAASANDALEELTRAPASIVFCDVQMPVHDGLWLAEQIHTRWPGTALVMASGAHDMEIVTASRRHGAVAYISKPFGREMVLQALRQATSLQESSVAAG
jgi:CheY-like chemotaxis protein